MPRALTLRPPAKINLTLTVGPKRADGYHDVRTIMQAIGLSDTLTLTPRRGPFSLVVRGPGVAADRTNLVWQAAERLWQAAGRPGEPRDVLVKLEKSIPAAAGLGGGSADAAAALVGLRTIWGLRLAPRELGRIAAGLGSDVPFFLVGGTGIGFGRGDEVLPLQDAPRLGIVVIKPSFSVVTAEAYRWLDEDRSAGLEAHGRPPRELALGWPGGPIRLVNDLEEPVSRRHPSIAEIIEALVREGAAAAAMSGSGSAVFGVFSEAQAPRAARRLRRPDWLVLPTRTVSGAEASRRIGL